MYVQEFLGIVHIAVLDIERSFHCSRAIQDRFRDVQRAGYWSGWIWFSNGSTKYWRICCWLDLELVVPMQALWSARVTDDRVQIFFTHLSR